MLDKISDVSRYLRVDNCPECLTSSCVVEENLRLIQCGEATPHCGDEAAHDEVIPKTE
jgi:hypothetical protein